MAMNLELKIDTENNYSGVIKGSYNKQAIFGGVILSQSIIAAYKTVSEIMFLHSFQVYFLIRGDGSLPISYVVESIMDGRSYVRRYVSVRQNNNNIANVYLSFKVDEPPSTFTYTPMGPGFEKPEKYKSIKSLIKEKLKHSTDQKLVDRLAGYSDWLSDFPFDVKPFDADVQILTKNNETNKLRKWIKLRDENLLNLASSSSRHAILGFISDYAILQPILTMHSAESVGFMVSLDHVMWFHNHSFDHRNWLLLETECNIASNGTSLNNGRIWSIEGLLLASFMQEGIIRAPK